MLDLLGFPEWLPRRQPAAYRRAIAEFEALVTRIVSERRADGIDRGDLLSLAARDPETGGRMSDQQLRDEILTIFAAGHETTATALSWIWYLLAQHPEAEARLHEELDGELGGRPPTYADLARLTWTRMVIEEAMRLYPPVHTTRTPGEDRIGGVRVPAGAVMSINTMQPIQSQIAAPERLSRAVRPGGVAAPSLCLSASRPRIWYRQRLPCRGGKVIATIAQCHRPRLAPGHGSADRVDHLRAVRIWRCLEPPGRCRDRSLCPRGYDRRPICHGSAAHQRRVHWREVH